MKRIRSHTRSRIWVPAVTFSRPRQQKTEDGRASASWKAPLRECVCVGGLQ